MGSSPKDRSPDERIDALRDEVTRLRRAFGVLTEMLIENDAFAVDRETARRRITKALRDVHSWDEAAEEDATGAETGPEGECASCGKYLAPDDPELTLQGRGRVCLSCFQRGG